MVTPERMGERFDRAEAAMDTLRDRIHAARLDVLLVVGDDQTELFRTTNNPAFAIYYGETIRNAKREEGLSDGWYRRRAWRARSRTPTANIRWQPAWRAG